jgi:hypothetical protein
MASPYTRIGLAAILAGTLLFAGIVGELVLGHDSNFLEAIEVLLVGAGIVALGFAIWELRKVAPSKRIINIGFWLSLVGVGFLILFAVIILIGVVLTGDLLEVFILFGLGFLLLIVGHLMFAPGLRHVDVLGQAWVLPLVAAAGAIVGIVVSADPIHDIGLIVFEVAWVAFGVALLRADRRVHRNASATG